MLVLHNRPSGYRKYRVEHLDWACDGTTLFAGVFATTRDPWDDSNTGLVLRVARDDVTTLLQERYFIGGLAVSPTRTEVAYACGFELNVHDYVAGAGSSRRWQGQGTNVPAWSPDGRWLLNCASTLPRPYDFRAWAAVFDASRPSKGPVGPPLMEDEPASPRSCAWSPTGDRVAIGVHGEIVLFDVHEGDVPASTRAKSLAETPSQKAYVQHLAFSPGGDLLAAASGWKIRVWDLNHPDRRRSVLLKGHRKEVTGLDYSPDGRFVVSSSLDETVRIWDPETGAETACYDWSVGAARSVACSPDGTTVAVGGSGRDSIVLFDVE